jgi:hypothetical protein
MLCWLNYVRYDNWLEDKTEFFFTSVDDVGLSIEMKASPQSGNWTLGPNPTGAAGAA